MKNDPHPISRRTAAEIDPEFIAIQALTFISADAELAQRFLALSGLETGDLRRAASSPGFLIGVLDYVVSDEALLLRFAADTRLAPEAVAAAQARLAGR